MIGRLTGRLTECTPGRVLLDVHGVGYEVQIPLGTFYALAGADGDTCTLLVHTLVREDALILFGFSTAEEKRAFEDLLAISGVGPRMALAVLSGIGPDDLEAAVREGDRSRLERIPGIGRKTAERILLDLRDRFERRARTGRRPPRGHPEEPVAPGSPGPRGDAVSALVHLGYPSDTAARAVDRALGETGADATLETVLKAALRQLVR